MSNAKRPALSAVELPKTQKPSAPPKQPTCNPPEAMSVFSDIVRRIEGVRKRRVFVLIVDEITDATFEDALRWRAELCAAGKADRLDVLIHSPGGVLSACYQMARLLSRSANAWDALIPSMAASGASLISLGSCNLVMSECAQLGPIDPQVQSKRNERFFATERQSPLEAFQAVKYLREFAITVLDANMRVLLNRGVAPKHALDASNNLAFHLVQPILSKIEPYDLGAFALDSSLSVAYCTRVGNPGDTQKRTQRQVDPRELVERYPAHEFVIDIEEAKALKFNVPEPIPELEALFDELRPRLDEVQQFIGFVPESGVDHESRESDANND